MVADELASDLAQRYVRGGHKVVDPFCGSGRLLAASAEISRRCVGIDTNPLAWLLSSAKFAKADIRVLQSVLAKMRNELRCISSPSFEVLGHRKVDWFSASALRELSKIVHWMNRAQFNEAEKLIMAACLSAATWDASFASKRGWKLHRLDPHRRTEADTHAIGYFEKRLRYCIRDMQNRELRGRANIILSDARNLLNPHRVAGLGRTKFDIVITSPPYGDSRTTVQYGAASSLCLAFACRIGGLEHLNDEGRKIDRRCLGGSSAETDDIIDTQDVRRYWCGKSQTILGQRVRVFLSDYRDTCDGIAKILTVGGKAIFVVGRRSTGSHRLKLDSFTKDCLEIRGLKIVHEEERKLLSKRLPRHINRFGAAQSSTVREKGLTPTIARETILVFEK